MGLTNTEKCISCGNDTFTICIDNEYSVVIYCCTKCKYVDTNWYEKETEVID